MSRYIREQVAIYGAVALLLMVILTLSRWESLPLSYWLMAILFAAFCGGVAAWEKWKRDRL
jgi:MFS-type transporter involved in bile tolerance (Atg22 family)